MIDIKEKLFKVIDDSAKQIFLNKLKISETIENSTQDKHITYLITDNPSAFYNNDQMFIDKIVLFLRKYQDFMYKVLVNCKTVEGKICLSSLVSNFFYTNTLSSASIEDEYLVILYRTLKNEIESLKTANNPQKFLEESINSFMLNNLIRNEDIKTYFGKVLNGIIEQMDNMDGQVLNFEPNELNNIITKRKERERERMAKQQQQAQRKTINSNSTQGSSIGSRTNSDSSNLSRAFTMRDPTKGDTSIGSGNEIDNANNSPLIQFDEFFKKYIPDLTKKELTKKIDQEKNQNMKEYIMKQINEYKNNDYLYANSELLDAIYQSKESNDVLILYKDNFYIAIELIKALFNNLKNNISIIPNSIRYICKIIALQIKKKFPQITAVELNAFIAEFFFEKLMRPIFTIPDYNGLLTSKIVSAETKKNIILIQNIVKQIVTGNFYKAKENPNFTIFNWFFLEIMPDVLQFFDELTKMSLPPILEKLIGLGDKMDTYVFDYFKEYPGEQIRLMNVCYTVDDIINIMDVIKKNETLFIIPDIDRNVYQEYDFFKAAINKMKSKDRTENLLKAKRNESKDPEKQTKTFTLITESVFSEELKYLTKLSRKQFTLKEIETPKDENERDLSVLIKVKNAMSEVLYNFHDIPKNDFFGIEINSTSDFISALISLSSINYYNLDNSVQTEWYILSLQSLYTKLKEDYKKDDYNKLYCELSNEIEKSLKKMDYDKMCQIVDRYRYSTRELKQTEISLKGLEHVEFNKKVQDFIDNANVEVYMKMVSQEKGRKLSIISKDASLNMKFKYLDNFLFENRSDNGRLYPTIYKFITHFPSLIKTQHDEEIFVYEKKIDLPKALKDYFAIIKQCLKTYRPLLPNAKKEEVKEKDKKEKKKDKKDKEKEPEIDLEKENPELLNRMFKEIKKYIMNRLYDKLYPPEADLNDLKIYQRCSMLSWVEPQHLCKVQKLNLDNFLPSTVGYIQKLDTVKNPYEKIQLFEKVIEIILNTLTFCIGKKIEGGVDDQLPLLIYVIIKAQPQRLSSNLSFIELFCEEIGFGPEAQKFAMLSAIKERLLNFTYTDLNGVSEEQYNKNCASQN